MKLQKEYKLPKQIKKLTIGFYVIIGVITTLSFIAESAVKIKNEIFERKIVYIAQARDTEPSHNDQQHDEPNEPAGTEGLQTQEQIKTRIKEVFGEDGEVAIRIAQCESSLNPEAVGDTHLPKSSFGLFQINQQWHDYTQEELLDPETNIKVAKNIKDTYGWRQWSTYKNGCYLTK